MADGSRFTVGSNQHKQTLKPPSGPEEVTLPVPLSETAPRPNPYAGPDAVLAESREALCAVLDALDEHRDALTLAGAHAVHERTKELPIASTTTKDGDLALTPSLVTDEPVIEAKMREAGFRPLHEFETELAETKPDLPRRFRDQPGLWGTGLSDTGEPIGEVDLLVPTSIAGAGSRRSARALKQHGAKTTRHTPGLELAVLDRDLMEIENFADGTTREAFVAGHAGLVCAKAYKLGERVEERDKGSGKDRVLPKDAVDMWRLMATSDGADVRGTFEEYSNDAESGAAIRKGITYVESLLANGDIQTLAVAGLQGTVEESEVVSVIETWAAGFTGS